MALPFATARLTVACLLALSAGLSAVRVDANEPQQTPVASGRATFQQFCAPCHGPMGKGNGAIAAYLLKPPADVTQLRRRNNGVFPQADLEEALLATSRDQRPRLLAAEEILWGPVFRSLGPDAGRTLVADLLAYLESVQEQ